MTGIEARSSFYAERRKAELHRPGCSVSHGER